MFSKSCLTTFYFQEWAIIKGYTGAESMWDQEASAEKCFHVWTPTFILTTATGGYTAATWPSFVFSLSLSLSPCHFSAEHLWPCSLVSVPVIAAAGVSLLSVVSSGRLQCWQWKGDGQLFSLFSTDFMAQGWRWERRGGRKTGLEENRPLDSFLRLSSICFPVVTVVKQWSCSRGRSDVSCREDSTC